MDSPRGVEQILGALPQTCDLSAPVPAREQPWELGAIRDQTLTLTSALGWGDDPRSHPRPPPAQPQPQGSPSLQAGDAQGKHKEGEGMGSTQHSCPKVWAWGKRLENNSGGTGWAEEEKNALWSWQKIDKHLEGMLCFAPLFLPGFPRVDFNYKSVQTKVERSLRESFAQVFSSWGGRR